MSVFRALPKHVKEIRIQFCNRSPASDALRSWTKTSYAQIKQHNPSLPLLIRESQNAQPKMVFRFERGQEDSVPLEGLSEKEISSQWQTLTK